MEAQDFAQIGNFWGFSILTFDPPSLAHERIVISNKWNIFFSSKTTRFTKVLWNEGQSSDNLSVLHTLDKIFDVNFQYAEIEAIH